MADFPSNPIDVLSSPVGDLISAVGRGVADAQQALDAQTIANFVALYNGGAPQLAALREMGYQPTWYTIPEVTAELTVALTLSGDNEPAAQKSAKSTPSKIGAPKYSSPLRLYAAPVDAGYANRYEFDLKAASTVKFRIVPVPAPAAASDLKIAPALVGKTWREARALLEQSGVAYQLPAAAVSDAAKVDTQSPAPGEVILTGRLLSLTFTT